MKKLVLALGLLSAVSTTAFADAFNVRIKVFNAVVPCAAEMTGLQPHQVDVSLKTGRFLGSTPSRYEMCVVPRLQKAGLKAPHFSPVEFNYDIQTTSLAAFINTIAVRNLQ